MNKSNNHQHLGFVAIIVPVVIGLLGILGAVGVAKVDQRSAASRDSLRLQQIQELRQALQTYKSKIGSFPIHQDEKTDGLADLTKALVTDTKLLSSVPRDPKSEDNWDYRYWSNGSVYSLRYLTEEDSRQEQLVYGQ